MAYLVYVAVSEAGSLGRTESWRRSLPSSVDETSIFLQRVSYFSPRNRLDLSELRQLSQDQVVMEGT